MRAQNAFLLLCLILAGAVGASWSLDILVLGRLVLLGAIVLALGLILWQSRQRAGWSRLTLSLALAGFVNLTLGESFHRGWPTAWVAGATALLALLAAGWWLWRGGGQTGPGKSFAVPGRWILGFGVLCGAGLGIATLLSGGTGALGPASMRALHAAGLAALFVLSAHCLSTRRREGILLGLLCAALLAAVALGATRFRATGNHLAAAALEIQSGRLEEAAGRVDKAEAMNAVLRWTPFRLQALELRRDIQMAQKQYDSALETMGQYLMERRYREIAQAGFARTGGSPQRVQLRQFYRDYLKPQPLEPLLLQYSRPERALFFQDIHSPSEQGQAEEALLILLFLRNGFLDRLEEYYASSGFPQQMDLGECIEALQAIAASEPGQAELARFFLAVAHFEAGNYAEAREKFEKVLEAEPDHAYALGYLERIALLTGDEESARLIRNAPRRISHAMLVGNRRWGLNIRDVLWGHVLLDPGTYAIDLEVAGGVALDAAPLLSVYFNNHPEPVFRTGVEHENWGTVSFQTTVEADGVHQLRLVLENSESGRNLAGELENRNLMFRGMTIRRIANPAGEDPEENAFSFAPRNAFD